VTNASDVMYDVSPLNTYLLYAIFPGGGRLTCHQPSAKITTTKNNKILCSRQCKSHTTGTHNSTPLCVGLH